MITSWSFSSLMDYEACPLRAKHKLDKAPKPPYVENRGTALHARIEKYLFDTPDDFNDIHPKARDEIQAYKKLLLTEDFESAVEGKIGIDKNWRTVPYDQAWGKAIMDLSFCKTDDTLLTIVDWKSGKSEGNEIKHIMQGQLYALMNADMFKHIQVEFLYLDEGKTRRNLYHKEQIQKWQPKWQTRAAKMTQAMIFPPKPSKANCRFCAYGPQGSDICTFGITQ